VPSVCVSAKFQIRPERNPTECWVIRRSAVYKPADCGRPAYSARQRSQLARGLRQHEWFSGAPSQVVAGSAELLLVSRELRAKVKTEGVMRADGTVCSRKSDSNPRSSTAWPVRPAYLKLGRKDHNTILHDFHRDSSVQCPAGSGRRDLHSNRRRAPTLRSKVSSRRLLGECDPPSKSRGLEGSNRKFGCWSEGDLNLRAPWFSKAPQSGSFMR
jgi:hypothetical protein